MSTNAFTDADAGEIEGDNKLLLEEWQKEDYRRECQRKRSI